MKPAEITAETVLINRAWYVLNFVLFNGKKYEVLGTEEKDNNTTLEVVLCDTALEMENPDNHLELEIDLAEVLNTMEKDGSCDWCYDTSDYRGEHTTIEGTAPATEVWANLTEQQKLETVVDEITALMHQYNQ